MSDIKKILQGAGIKPSPAKSTPLFLVSPYIDPQKKTTLPTPVLSSLQNSILNDSSSSQVDLNIWKFMNKSSYRGSSPQKSIETFLNLSKGEHNIAVLDIETLGGVGDPSSFWLPTEISMKTYTNTKLGGLSTSYKNPATSLNILISPEEESKKKIEGLVKKIKAGKEISGDERMVLAHLLRYGDGFEVDPETGIIKQYSKYFDLAEEFSKSSSLLLEHEDQFEVALQNLKKYGMSESQAKATLAGALKDMDDYTLIGHNIKHFDKPKLIEWGESEVQKALENIETLDTLDLIRIIEDNPELFHETLSGEPGGGLGGAMSRSPYSMDAIRETLEMSTERAHIGDFDTEQTAKVAGVLAEKFEKFVEGKDIAGVDWEQFTLSEIPSGLVYDSSPIKKGDIFFARRGLRGDGVLDFAINVETGKKTYGDYVLNRGFFYEFMGYSTVKDAQTGQEVYVAEFFSETLNRRTYFVSDSVEGLADKIHSPSFIPWQLEGGIKGSLSKAGGVTEKTLRETIEGNFLDDLSRRRWQKMFQIEDQGSNYYGKRLLEDFLSIAEIADSIEDLDQLGEFFFSPEMRRDFERMFPRLKSEAPYLRQALDAINNADMSETRKNMALARWYHTFNKEVPASAKVLRPRLDFENVGIDLWDPSSIAQKRFVNFADDDSFAQSVYDIINRNILEEATPAQQEVTKEAALRRIVGDLQARGVLDRADAQEIFLSDNLRSQITVLRSKLVGNENISLAANLEVESLLPRDIDLSFEKNQELVQDAIDWVQDRTVKRGEAFKNLPGKVAEAINFAEGKESKRLTSTAFKILSDYAQERDFVVIPVLGEGDRPMAAIFAKENKASVIQSMIKEEKSPLATYVELPYLDKQGNIKFGRQKRVRQIGRATRVLGADGQKRDRLSVIDPIDDVLTSLRNALNFGLPKSSDLAGTDSVTAQSLADLFNKGMNRGLEGLSGTTFAQDPYDAINSLEVSGTVSDILKGSYLRAADLIPGIEDMSPKETYEALKNLPSFLNEHKADLAPAFQEYFSNLYGRDLSLEEVEELMHFSYRGVRDSSLYQGSKAIISPMDPARFTAFGQYLPSRRPNIIQRLNYIPLDYDSVVEKVSKTKGITQNPLIISETMDAAYQNVLGPKHVTGLRMRGIAATYDDILEILGDNDLSRIARPDTWEQLVILSPDAAESLATRTSKEFVINLNEETLDEVLSNILEGKINPSDTPIFIGEDYGLSFRNTPEGKTVWTRFTGRKGQITGVKQDGENVIVSIDAISEVVNGTKLDIDGRKGTVRIFDRFHEFFGDDVQFAFSPSPLKHMDFLEADLGGILGIAANEYKGTRRGRRTFKRAMKRNLGVKGRWTKLPGQGNEYTFVVPDEIDLTEVVETKGQNVKRLLQDLKILPFKKYNDGAYEVPLLMSEVRRMNVAERKYFSNWEGEGIELGRGAKVSLAEELAIRYKGAEYGVDIDPILKWFQSETESSNKFYSNVKTMEGLKETLGAMLFDEKLQKVKVKSLNDLKALPKFASGDTSYKMNEIAGTILGQNEVFAIEIPDSIEIITERHFGGDAKETKTINKLVFSKQLIQQDEEGNIFLNSQQRSAKNIYEQLLILDELGDADEEAKRAVLDKIQFHYQEYLDEIVSQLPSSKGFVKKQILTGTMPTSGYFTAHGMSPPTEWTLENANIVVMSKDRALKMFGEEGLDYIENNEFYALVMRNPNIYSDSMQSVRVLVSDQLQGDELSVSSPIMTRLGGDFDGDAIAAYMPWTKKLVEGRKKGAQDFDEIQEALRKLNQAQSTENLKIMEILRATGARHGGAVGEDEYSKGLFAELAEALLYEDKKEELFSLLESFSSQEIDDVVFRARVGKITTGPLFNVSQRAREFAIHVFDPESEAYELRLIDEMGHVSSEPMSIKSKHGGVNVEENLELLKALRTGKYSDLEKYSQKYGDLLKSDIVWSHEDIIRKHAELLGYGDMSIEELAGSEAGELVEKAARGELGRDMLKAFGEMRERVRRASPQHTDAWFESSAKFGYSNQAARDIKSAYESLDSYSIPLFKNRKISTLLNERYKVKSSQKAFDAAMKKYMAEESSPFMHGQMPKWENTIDEGAARQKFSAWAETINWKNVGKDLAIGTGIAVGLYLTSRALRDPLKEDEEQQSVPQQQQPPTARIVPPQGLNVKIKAKNQHNADITKAASLVGQEMNSKFGSGNGEVNINQIDNTRSINDEWIQELFTQAINRS